MDEADEELRQTLRRIWPLKAKKNIIDLVVPPNTGYSSLKYFISFLNVTQMLLPSKKSIKLLCGSEIYFL